MSSPQITCPDCKTSMNYTAAACPNCKRRMVATPGNPNSGAGVQPINMSRSTIIGGVLAGVTIFGLIIFCCSRGSNNQTTYQEQRATEMAPVREEMQRKMNQGKSREQAAEEIVNEETLRQIIREQQQNKNSK